MFKFTKAEEEIMHAIWSLKAATVGDVLQWLESHGKTGEKPANSTISTMLRIMEEKGYLTHTTVGRVFLYSARITKKQYARQSLAALITDYFQGSPSELISTLVEQEKLSPSDLTDLQKLLDNADKKKKS